MFLLYTFLNSYNDHYSYIFSLILAPTYLSALDNQAEFWHIFVFTIECIFIESHFNIDKIQQLIRKCILCNVARPTNMLRKH